MTIHEAIRMVLDGENLSAQESADVFGCIMSGGATAAQIAALLVGLRMKGETVDEITGAATAMREKATRVVPETTEFLVDTCGTGGDKSGTFNISTAAALVAAGAGARVAKHGNRSVSSRSGSADVLESLGVNISLPADRMKACIDEAGIGFLFAPSVHAAMKHAIGPRKEIAVRTIFNILGPLTNPSFAPAQILGVFSGTLTETLAGVLAKLGARRAFVVHGADGLDELSVTAPSKISELNDGNVETYEIMPEQFGLHRWKPEDIQGGTAEENASIIRDVLSGKPGAAREIVVLNAGFAIAASGKAQDPNEGIRMAAESLDSGSAAKKLEMLVRISQS